MGSQVNVLPLDDVTSAQGKHDPSYFVGRALSYIRWIIISATLAITFLWPFQGRLGHALWMLILSFAAYNLLIELVRYRVPRFRSFRWTPPLDLLVVGVLYFLDFDPGGPSFVFFYLALLTAAGTLPVRWTILYTLAVVVTVAIIAPTLPGWSIDPANLRQLASRLIVMVIVGIGTSILTRRLALEYEQARSMRNEAERLVELDRLRNEFVSSVSHDLRTPLTAVRAGLGMLESKVGERLQADERQMWGNARRNVERLGLLIDDLLTLNQLQAGVLELDRESLDLRALVTGAVATVSPLLHEKRQTLETDLPVPLPVAIDPWRVEQVLVNVLANAHRHTPGGTRITIIGRIVEDDVQLAVSDTGPGIPPDHLEAVFERFHRVRNGEKGSGLGLAIGRALVDLHGGKMWAESQPGSGTTFYIRLPGEQRSVQHARPQQRVSNGLTDERLDG